MDKILERGVGSTIEIQIFLEMEEANVDFKELLAESNFKGDFTFAVILLEKLKGLNVTLTHQGQEVFAHEML